MAAMIGRVSLDDWIAIVAKAIDDAIAGKPSARKWLSDYLLGQPVQRSVSASVRVDLAGMPDKRRLDRLRAILVAAMGDGLDDAIDGANGLDDGAIDGELLADPESDPE